MVSYMCINKLNFYNNSSLNPATIKQVNIVKRFRNRSLKSKLTKFNKLRCNLLLYQICNRRSNPETMYLLHRQPVPTSEIRQALNRCHSTGYHPFDSHLPLHSLYLFTHPHCQGLNATNPNPEMYIVSFPS